MKAIDKIIIILGVIAAVVAVGFLLPALRRGSNCGGNSAALSVCQTCVTTIQIASEDKTNSMDARSIPVADRVDLVNSVKSTSSTWCGGAKFLIRTNALIDPNPRQLLVVCDTPFDNVPQPTFWNGYRKNPAHAVGYSDGTKGLISTEEFKKLDLSGFIEVTMLGTNAGGVLTKTNKSSF